MTNETNQLTVLDNQTGEIIQSNGNVVRETNKHVVMLNEKVNTFVKQNMKNIHQ